MQESQVFKATPRTLLVFTNSNISRLNSTRMMMTSLTWTSREIRPHISPWVPRRPYLTWRENRTPRFSQSQTSGTLHPTHQRSIFVARKLIKGTKTRFSSINYSRLTSTSRQHRPNSSRGRRRSRRPHGPYIITSLEIPQTAVRGQWTLGSHRAAKSGNDY